MTASFPVAALQYPPDIGHPVANLVADLNVFQIALFVPVPEGRITDPADFTHLLFREVSLFVGLGDFRRQLVLRAVDKVVGKLHQIFAAYLQFDTALLFLKDFNKIFHLLYMPAQIGFYFRRTEKQNRHPDMG